jgi:hypothetical protein
MQSPEDLSGRPITEYRTIMNRSFRSPQRVICLGSCVFQGRPGTPVWTQPLPTALSVALCLEQILLVVVILVLDLLRGVNLSARVTRAARFGRSLSLPYKFTSFV